MDGKGVFNQKIFLFGTDIGCEAFKEEEGGRKIMCEAVEKYVDGKRIDALHEAVKKLMETMKWTAEQAMEAMKSSEVDRKFLVPRL